METVRSADGTKIAFDRYGQGPALVIVGGATSMRAHQAAFAGVAASDFTVFAYDRRGRGDSGDTQPYAVGREVEDVDAVIGAAGGSAFVLGHSSGAVLALEAALRLPTRIKKLAVYEPPFVVDNSRPPAPPDYRQQLETLIAAGRRGDAVDLFQRVVGLSPEMIAGARQSPMWPGLEAIAHTLVYDAAVMGDTMSGRPDTIQKFAAIRVPTLVMDGTLFLGQPEGHTFMRHGANALALLIPNAQRLTLEGQDHGADDHVLFAALKPFFLGEGQGAVPAGEFAGQNLK